MQSLTLVMLGLIGFGTQRSIRRMKSLQGEERVIARDAMASAVAATLSIFLAGSAYVLWSQNRNTFLLASAMVGFGFFVASVVWVVRVTQSWSDRMLRQKRHPV